MKQEMRSEEPVEEVIMSTSMRPKRSARPESRDADTDMTDTATSSFPAMLTPMSLVGGENMSEVTVNGQRRASVPGKLK